MYFNPNSKRQNPFQHIYDNEEFKSALERKHQIADFPYLVDIELTNNCNLRCIFCGQQAMTRPKGFISEHVFKKVVDECAERGTAIRLIRWGEPFLHPQIIEFVRYAKSKNILVHITNNGTMINEEQMKALIEIGLDSLIFSFQGATKEEYQLMRNNDRYDDLARNVRRFIELRGNTTKPFVHISSTMTDETKEQVDDFVRYWGNIVDSVQTGKTNLSRLNDHQIRSFEKVGKLHVLRTKETIKKEYRPCSEVYQKLSVDYDGLVSCCCGDYDAFMTVGSVNESSLHDIWNNSPELKMFRTLLDRGRHKSLTLCSTCYHTYDEF